MLRYHFIFYSHSTELPKLGLEITFHIGCNFVQT